MIECYDADAVAAALPMDHCIDLMEEVQMRLSRGDIELPLRQLVPHGAQGQGLLVMPGSLGAGDVFGAKMLSLFPDNPSQGRPAIQGSVLLFDPATGAPVALVDAASLTALRTAAASGAATRALARPDAASLAILGYGVQADSHLTAMAAVRKLREVRVWGPSVERAQAFADRQDPGIPVRAAKTAEEAVRGADLICAVSASQEPIIDASWVSPGAHINLVGAHAPGQREASGLLMGRGRVFTEITAFALEEAGDILLAMAEGALHAHELTEIGRVFSGDAPGRQNEADITLYKSLGNTAQDLAAARVVHERTGND